MNYSDLKKLDEETLKKLTEGLGPCDECLCSILAPPEGEKRGFRQSIKKAFASIGHRRLEKKRIRTQLGRHGLENALKSDSPGHNTVEIPLTYTKGGKGIYTTREAVKAPFCGKCRCEYENIVLKHSYANIRITSPDISSICPCPNDCLPGKRKLKNNIKVTIERVAVDSLAAGIPEFDSQYSCEDLAQSSLDTIPQSEYSNSLEHQDHNTN